jgi:hypothetical protein
MAIHIFIVSACSDSVGKILLRLFAARNFMNTACQIVVCGSLVPEPLPTLEPAR